VKGVAHQSPGGPTAVTYGSEIILSDASSGISTAPLVVRKVEKNRIVIDDGAPVSQMQKIALQRINPDGTSRQRIRDPSQVAMQIMPLRM
jgi:hypothetical protein